MKILCLCPTYGRPRLVANAVACFLAQDYPAADRKLLILDDAGQIESQDHGAWQVLSTPERFPSLPAKYNAMLVAEGILPPAPGLLPEVPGCWDAVAVWDDDDIYLSWHLTAAAAALAGGAPSCKPSRVWSLYNAAEPFKEQAAGRFHGSLVITADRLRQLGGWIDTRRADFDQQQITACGPAADMLEHSPAGKPSYIFRWQSTGAAHCQGLMSSPANEDWYARYQPTDRERVATLVPQMDDETVTVLGRLAGTSE